METETRPTNGPDFDPEQQLDELRRASDVATIEAWLPPTPVWHAPLLSLALVAVALLGTGNTGWQLFGLIAGGAALVFGLWDTFRKRKATPRRMGKPWRIFVFYFIIVVVSLMLVNLIDGTIDNAFDRWPDSMPMQLLTITGVWLVGAVLFAIGVATTNTIRDRWVDRARATSAP